MEPWGEEALTAGKRWVSQRPVTPEPSSPRGAVVEAAVIEFPKPLPRGGARLIIPLMIAGLVFWGQGSILAGAVVMGAFILKDLVNFALMVALEAPDPDLLMLPLLNQTRQKEVPAWKDGVVVVGGMAAMLVVSVLVLIWYRSDPTEEARQLVYATVGVALFSLVPLYPYDGWRLLNITVFSRSLMLELVVTVITALIVALLSLLLQLWFLLVFSALALLGFGALNRQRKIVERLRAEGVPPTPWDAAMIRRLAEAAADGYPMAPKANAVAILPMFVQWMRRISTKLLTHPPGLGASFALLFVYGAIGLYSIAALVMAAK